jgi:hypothetical protein
VCTWAEQREARLSAVTARWEQLNCEQDQLKSSFEQCESQLKHMEANPSVALGELAQRVTQLQVHNNNNNKRLPYLCDSLSVLMFKPT